VGYQSGYTNTTGTGLTCLGYRSAYLHTTGFANTAIGAFALYSNTTGDYNTAVGHSALDTNTTGGYNVAVGRDAMGQSTTASNSTVVGVEAGGSLTTGQQNVMLGTGAGYNATTASYNTLLGRGAGFALTTGSNNTFVGAYDPSTGSSGGEVTTGSNNTILGAYNGNQGGLDIRTASNHIVLSDGDGNPRLYANSNGYWQIQATGITNNANSAALRINGGSGAFITQFFGVTGGGENGAFTAMGIGKDNATNRSINAGGTINASGADYAEYMTKSGNFTVAKGDVVGLNSEGKLTNVFTDAISFVVKSTSPSYVGGDSWGADIKDTAELEIIRQTVDRIAFAGQVPVNVTGATAGQYIIPVNDNGAIKGVAVSNPTFEQYQQAVGKVIAIEQDGRARIIVKVA
jgi:hypothetical protein